MSIGDIARIMAPPAKTIRYYEKVDLVNPALDNNYHRFDDSDLHKLGLIVHARSLRCTIEDCRALLVLYEKKDRATANVRRIARDHLVAIKTKIAVLTAMRTTLRQLVESRRGDNRPVCPVVEDFAVISQ